MPARGTTCYVGVTVSYVTECSICGDVGTFKTRREANQAADDHEGESHHAGRSAFIREATMTLSHETVEVPSELLAATADHIRSLGNHWKPEHSALERVAPSQHDTRMSDGSCMTCALLQVLESYQTGVMADAASTAAIEAAIAAPSGLRCPRCGAHVGGHYTHSRCLVCGLVCGRWRRRVWDLLWRRDQQGWSEC